MRDKRRWKEKTPNASSKKKKGGRKTGPVADPSRRRSRERKRERNVLKAAAIFPLCTVAAIRDDSPGRAGRKSIEQRSVNCVIMSEAGLSRGLVHPPKRSRSYRVTSPIVRLLNTMMRLYYSSISLDGNDRRESRSPISPPPPAPRDRVPRKDRRGFLRRRAVGLPT